MGRYSSSNTSRHLILGILVVFLFLVYKFLSSTSSLASSDDDDPSKIHSLDTAEGITIPKQTLVIYVCTKKHAFAEENLAFFIRTAVRSSHGADYYFILQNGDLRFDQKALPTLPANAHYIEYDGKCLEMGAIGWFLSYGQIDRTKYKYFIFLTSSVRGPFIVAYYDNSIWYTIFTQRLNDHVKLVGCTLSCDTFPHVQSYFWAMKLDTLDFFLKNSSVFDCYQSTEKTTEMVEIGASRALLQAGYAIDSLMTKYRGVNMRLNSTEKCTNKLNPLFSDAADGITLDPYEIVFVNTNVDQRHNQEKLKRLDMYEKWIHQRQQ